jgi:hypothetical protein
MGVLTLIYLFIYLSLFFGDPHLFSLYTWELNFGQTIRDQRGGATGNNLGNNLRTWGILWELNNNLMRT